MRALITVALFMLVALLAGCPRDLAAPEHPGGATPCSSLADCQPDAGVLCGELRNCVDQRCEAEPSLFVPCPR